MDSMTTWLMSQGVLGVVVIGLSWICRKLYLDLQEARDELDDARVEALATLERVIVKAYADSMKASPESWESK